MSVTDLKEILRKNVESISDEGVLEVLIDVVSHLDDDSSAFQLTQEQREQLFKSYDESFDESNLENWFDLKKSFL